MARKKMSKKTRTIISGLLVGVASIFAVINFAEIPADEVQRFLVSTVIFFVGIIVLALLAVSMFKLLGWIGRLLVGGDDDDGKPPQDSDDRDRE